MGVREWIQCRQVQTWKYGNETIDWLVVKRGVNFIVT